MLSSRHAFHCLFVKSASENPEIAKGDCRPQRNGDNFRNRDCDREHAHDTRRGDEKGPFGHQDVKYSGVHTEITRFIQPRQSAGERLFRAASRVLHGLLYERRIHKFFSCMKNPSFLFRRFPSLLESGKIRIFRQLETRHDSPPCLWSPFSEGILCS